MLYTCCQNIGITITLYFPPLKVPMITSTPRNPLCENVQSPNRSIPVQVHAPEFVVANSIL